MFSWGVVLQWGRMLVWFRFGWCWVISDKRWSQVDFFFPVCESVTFFPEMWKCDASHFLSLKKVTSLPPPRDLGERGASIVRCGLSCLVDLNSDLYRLCGSLHGLDTFWARGLSWINRETTTTTKLTQIWNGKLGTDKKRPTQKISWALDVGVCYSITDTRFPCYISLSTI